ncbi:MAG: molybdopterin-guanine dinucleotide biosynthesis protein MobB [Synergistales bacterium]|nr:molybdopterin-guanine dinucleotide biosynthesis protein MobB [Synergistales bacterium]
MPYVLAVSGFKASGKTTFCRSLVQYLTERNWQVGYIKHSRHEVCSPQGTDMGGFAGSVPSVWWGEDGARMELPGTEDIHEITARCFPGFDLVVLEGGKQLPFPRIWLGPPSSIPEGVTGVFAVHDREAPEDDHRREPALYGKDGAQRLFERVDGILQEGGTGPLEVYVGGRRVPVKAFVGEFIRGGVAGMIRALKGVSDPETGGIVLAAPPRRRGEREE